MDIIRQVCLDIWDTGHPPDDCIGLTHFIYRTKAISQIQATKEQSVSSVTPAKYTHQQFEIKCSGKFQKSKFAFQAYRLDIRN